MTEQPTVVTGVGLALAGVETAGDVLNRTAGGIPPVDPAARIGKKGLRYKDRATQLALVAADDALRDAGLRDGAGRDAVLTVPPASVAVVVSSNFGNLDSVCEVVRVIAEEQSTRLVSPITTPNLSSNVIASEVAIRFALRGPNLMVCNGATSGLDAVYWAKTWLGSERATHVLVLGVETDNPIVRELVGTDHVLDGAAAIVLERAGTAAGRGATVHAELGRYVRTSGVHTALSALGADGADAAGWYLPEGGRVADGVLPGTARFDLSTTWGRASGALGVLQCVSAIGQFAAGTTGPLYAVSGADSDDAAAGILLRPGLGECTMTDTAVKILLTESTTVTYTPGYEGANIGTVIGFKHVNYLVEKAVIDHFRRSGLAVGALYERHGLGFDVTHIESRINTALIVDDEASIEVTPATEDGANELTFTVVMTVERDGERKKVVTSTVRAVLRYDDNDVRMPRRLPVPGCLDQFVVARIGAAEPGAAVGKLGGGLVSGGSTDHDPVLEQLTAGTNSYAWKFRIPYPYVHFFDRLQISGYLRLMEEAKHRFVDARGIGIRKLLQEQNWIPVVTHSTVTLLDEALLEEDLYIVYTVDSIFKNLLYTSTMDYYVVRNGHLVRTATGVITHAYGVLENGKEGRLVGWDERVATALLGASAGS